MPKKHQKYEINLKKFDMSKMRKDSTVVFIGKRRSGKSYTLRDLLYHNRDIPYGSIISGTEEASPFFADFVPSSYIFDEYNSAIPQKIIKNQKKKQKKAKKRGLDDKKDKFFFILDDCLYDDTWTRDKVIRSLFMNGRHYNIMFIITMQYPLGINPQLRTNIDYSFIFNDNNEENRERIYKSFAGVLRSRQIFDDVLNSLDKHECLVIDNTSSSTNISDSVFVYKAKERTGFKVGCEKYWRLHYENMKNKVDSDDDDSGSDSEEMYDDYNARKNIDNFIPSKKKINLKVIKNGY